MFSSTKLTKLTPGTELARSASRKALMIRRSVGTSMDLVRCAPTLTTVPSSNTRAHERTWGHIRSTLGAH
jgi:hypothetical protein